MNISMIKQRAREIARTNKASLARICLIVGTIASLPSLLDTDNIIMRFLHIVVVVLLLAVEQGYVVAGLKAVTDREYDLSDNDGIYGLVNWIEYLPTYLTKFLVNFICIVIFMILIFACTIGSVGGLFVALSDPYGVSPITGIASGMSVISIVCMLIIAVLFVFALCWINLRMFAMTYLHQEYGIKGFAALKESFALMKGHCWNLFLINLSFVGWIILCLIIDVLVSSLFGNIGIAGLLGSILSAALAAYTYQPAYITVQALYYKEIAYKFYDEGRI